MIGMTRDADVVIIELQREDRRNALNLDLCNALREAAQSAVDDGARAIVITGKGTAFCAGADLGGVYGPEFLAGLYGMLQSLTQLPVPLIAAINGPAIGGGTQLAMACDLRMADEKAVFGVPVARNGLAVDAWTIRTLRELAGGGVARRLLIAAQMLDRDQAVDCGLVDASGTLDDAIAWAHEIAALAPLAIAHNKLVLNGAPDEAIAKNFDAVWESADVREAAQARLDKRTPIFEGR